MARAPDAGRRQQHHAHSSSACSDTSRYSSSSSGAPTPTSTRHRPSAARDSAQSNVTGSVFSSRTSASTAYTVHSSPADSSAASPPLPVPAPAPQNYRDSFVSIVDDPFFLGLDTALDADAEFDDSDRSSSAESQPDGDDSQRSPRWPPPRRESLTIGPTQFWVRTYTPGRAVTHVQGGRSTGRRSKKH